MIDKDWNRWRPKVKEGQLLRLKECCSFSNGISGPQHQTLVLYKGDVVLFLSLRQLDWEMTYGPRGPMRHERRDYRLKVLHGDKVWQTGIIIVEGSFSAFERVFEVLENENELTPSTAI